MCCRCLSNGNCSRAQRCVKSADLDRRRNMMSRWAWSSCGMMARTADFLNVALADMLYQDHDKRSAMERVQEFLEKTG